MHPDSDPAGLGRPQTQTAQTQTAGGGDKIAAPGLGLGDAQTQTTQTQTQTQTRRGSFVAWIAHGGYTYLLTVIVSIIAALGQKVFAEDTAHFVNQIKFFGFDLTPWFAPAVYDLAVAALLHGGLRVARDRNSPWPWWIAGAGVGAFSIFTNMQHVGAMVTAPASAVLFLVWGLHLFNEYKKILRKRAFEDSIADDFHGDDVLYGFDRGLAELASRYASTKSMQAALAYRSEVHGENKITRRDVAIRAAEIFRDVFDDQFYVLTHPADAAPAGGEGTEQAGRSKKLRKMRRSRARRLATMTATDEVHRYLGVPVLNRTGLVPSRMTYAEPPAPALPPPPVHVPSVVYQQRQQVAGSPAPSPDDRPVAVRRRPATEPPPDREVVVLLPGQPGGPAGQNWLPVDRIPGLPYIHPTTQCEHSLTKGCKFTLLEHVQRRGKQVLMIVENVANWDVRPERVGKNVVKQWCGLGGDSQQMEIAGLFDHLRKLAQQQDGTEQPAIEAAPDDRS